MYICLEQTNISYKKQTMDALKHTQPPNEKIIAWFSGGITSAVTCKLCLDEYGKHEVRVIFIDTHNESQDTYRFLKDCEAWYGTEIEIISNKDYSLIEDVWYRYLSLNVATGAVCSYELKRVTRERFQRENDYAAQAFGFEYSKKEINRAKALKANHSKSKPIFPLIDKKYTKQDCVDLVQKAGIKIPNSYANGFRNNNCLRTRCVQGGIGYWQKMRREFPEKFDYMAKIEHDLTNKKGEPVTMLKDQAKGGGKLFLKPHPDYKVLYDHARSRPWFEGIISVSQSEMGVEVYYAKKKGTPVPYAIQKKYDAVVYVIKKLQSGQSKDIEAIQRNMMEIYNTLISMNDNTLFL